MQQSLHIRLLGEPQVWSGDKCLPLPPSKKTRALLGYLLLTGRPQRRERLCQLFWDVTDDPRAALRWSLSKLREVLEGDGQTRLVTDREQVSIAADGLEVDALSLRALLKESPARLPDEVLSRALPLFRGELLEGLELPEFPAYYAFCVAERSAFRALHHQVLSTLLARREGNSAEALPLLRALVQLDPQEARYREQLFALLRATGRGGEAEQQSRVADRLLQDEPTPAREAEEESSGRASLLFEPEPRLHESRPFVGRAHELLQLTMLLRGESAGLRTVLIVGEPGIGKSRLLSELLLREQARGVRVRSVRVPEERSGFTYAPFRELLGTLDLSGLDAGQRKLMGPLLGAGSDGPSTLPQREELFRAVASCLATCAAHKPLLVALEDAHGIDEGSLALLQFVISVSRRVPLTFVLTARRGELYERPAVLRVLRALKRDAHWLELSLGPLAEEETRALLRALGAASSGDRVFAMSGGHPLFAVELARHEGHATQALPSSLVELIRDRLMALEPEQADVLRWASALGTTFDSDTLGRLITYRPEQLVAALEQLEQHGFLRFEGAQGSSCTFAHQVVREAVYHQLSEPRRKLMHARIAQLSMELGELTDERAADVVHHAVLAGDNGLATRACLMAARRCLRLFAPREALSLVRRGLAHAETLPEPTRTTLSIDLLHVAIGATRPLDEELLSLLTTLANRALDMGDATYAQRAFFLRSLAYWEQGRLEDADRFSRESERISRAGDLDARLSGLGDTARCLVCLERELPEAEAFLLQAEALSARNHKPLPMRVLLARGTLSHYRGQYQEARDQLAHARQLARAEGDRVHEFYALELLIDLHMQQGEYDAALRDSGELCELAERIRQGSEAPLARTLLALSRYAAGLETSHAAVLAAIEQLRLTDAKQRSALVLTRVAEQELRYRELSSAREHAQEALRLATLIVRTSEAFAARALLALVAHAEGDAERFAAAFAGLRNVPSPLSIQARSLVERASSLFAGPAVVERGAKKKPARSAT